MDVCLRVLRQFRQLQRQERCVDHIPLITFLDCRVHIFSDNLSRNSCRIRPVLDDLFRANSLNVIKWEKILAFKRSKGLGKPFQLIITFNKQFSKLKAKQFEKKNTIISFESLMIYFEIGLRNRKVVTNSQEKIALYTYNNPFSDWSWSFTSQAKSRLKEPLLSHFARNYKAGQDKWL